MNYGGQVIGDVILFYLAKDQFNLVGRAPALNWIQYHAARGGYDVNVELDERVASEPIQAVGNRIVFNCKVLMP